MEERSINGHIIPRENQSNIIKEIQDAYEASLCHSVAFYIHGKTSSGKSSIPILLAIEMKTSICKSFNPTEPGDVFENLYETVAPTITKPLIVVFEEVDCLIKMIDNGKCRHKDIPISVKNKYSWNTFWDDLKILYPYVIFIMTSNVPPTDIDKLDESYLGHGRINGSIRL